MQDTARALKTVLGIYALLGLLLWPMPLLGILHVESTAVVAAVAFFAAGLHSFHLFEQRWTVRQVLGAQEGALVVPWFMLSVTLLWTPNCGYLQGLLFFMLFPVVSVVLAVALAFALQAGPWRRKRSLFVGVGLAVALLTPAYDLGLHPQFYTYNHVFGGVLGPIYDEELALRAGLFTFRGLTLLWALFLYRAGCWLQDHRHGLRLLAFFGGETKLSRSRAPERSLMFLYDRAGREAGSMALLLALCYLWAAPLGINTPAWYIQQELGGHHRTEHFNIYYDPDAIAPRELQVIAQDHEYQYDRLRALLNVQVDGRIDSYLYPNPAAKARLTGARATSVAPVWLPAPQTHLLAAQYEDVFPHELVHVFSRTFGGPILNASLAVGLVEGLAVALEPPTGRPSPDDQVAAALGARETGYGSLVEDVASRLEPLGFWTGRGAVSYTTMGSFVSYLLEAYGAAPFKQAYAWGNLEAVYGKAPAVLASEWRQHLTTQLAVARSAAALAERRFSRPSLFEVRCPHYVPPYRRHYREGRRALAAGDTLEALEHFEASLLRQPAYVPALNGWARVKLARGQPAAVAARLDTLGEEQPSAALLVRRGEAYSLLGRPRQARVQYARAQELIPLYRHDMRARLILRAAVASRAGVTKVLTSGASPAIRGRRLAALPDLPPAALLLQALLFYEGGHYAQAARLMRSAPDLQLAANQGMMERQRMVWRAEIAFRRAKMARAERYARTSVQAYRRVGDLAAAARLAHFVEKIQWQQRDP